MNRRSFLSVLPAAAVGIVAGRKLKAEEYEPWIAWPDDPKDAVFLGPPDSPYPLWNIHPTDVSNAVFTPERVWEIQKAIIERYGQ